MKSVLFTFPGAPIFWNLRVVDVCVFMGNTTKESPIWKMSWVFRKFEGESWRKKWYSHFSQYFTYFFGSNIIVLYYKMMLFVPGCLKKYILTFWPEFFSKGGMTIKSTLVDRFSSLTQLLTREGNALRLIDQLIDYSIKN